MRDECLLSIIVFVAEEWIDISERVRADSIAIHRTM